MSHFLGSFQNNDQVAVLAVNPFSVWIMTYACTAGVRNVSCCSQHALVTITVSPQYSTRLITIEEHERLKRKAYRQHKQISGAV